MKRTPFKISYLATLFLLLFFSCKKHSDYQDNPNSPSTALPSLLLTNICITIFDYSPTEPAFASRQLTYFERGDENEDYSWTHNSFANFDVLRQVKDMDRLAEQSGQENYRGLAKFFRAVLFSQLTETYGDIPYSDALKALEGNTKPFYDKQEDVYVGILNELKEANSILDDSKGNIGGDIIYNGKASQWKKLVNAFRLRLLIHLSKKESNTRLNIKQQFQDIIGDPTQYPLMTGLADNGQIVFNATSTSNYYPGSGYLSLSTSISMERGFVDTLKRKSDPRLFSFAQPIAGQTPGIFANYAGVDAGLTLAAQQTISASASKINSRYYDINRPVNEPLILVGYPEQEFLIAEAISRGWITGAGTAQQHYENGITASMNFCAINDVSSATYINPTTIATYISSPQVAFVSANAIAQIITQKQIALFMQSGWEAFYEQRRTGIPTFDVGPGTANSGIVPKRWLYPQDEASYNKVNLDAALQSQYAGNDNVNAVMWLLQ